MTTQNKNTTHFGYQTVEANQKTGLVNKVFSSVANKYDLMNDIMSLTTHRLWKKHFINLSHIKPGMSVLDLAGGTGDISLLLRKKMGAEGNITVGDLNNEMLAIGRDRLTNEGFINNLNYIQLNAETLPFQNNQFDLITISFGLRNVTNQKNALKSMLAKLKPGGRVMILEFSKPTSAILEKIYNLYSFKFIPKVGEMITNDRDSYQYLVESIRKQPSQDELKFTMEEVGFVQCNYYNMFGGIVAIHSGYKN